MEYRISLATIALATSCFFHPFLLAQESPVEFDLSSAFVDINANSGDSEIRNLVTLDPIERVFGVNREDNNPGARDERISSRTTQVTNILEYLEDILTNNETSQLFGNIYSDTFREGSQANATDIPEQYPDGGALALSPILDALENNDLSDVSRQFLTDDFEGPSLLSVVSALRYAICLETEKQIIESNGEWKPTVRCERPGLGKITQWSFNETTGEGFIRIDDMKVDRYRLGFVNDNGNIKITYDLEEQSSYTWHISVIDPGYDEAKRMSESEYVSKTAGGNVVDPFVTSVQRTPPPPRHPSLPDDVKNPNNTDDSIWARGLDSRLTAHGFAIKVESITEKRFAMLPFDENTLGDDASLPLYIDFAGNYYVRGQVLTDTYNLDANHPYLQTSDKSCIDIMFAGKYPRHRIEFPGSQTGWCMGRCAHPVIANSK